MSISVRMLAPGLLLLLAGLVAADAARRPVIIDLGSLPGYRGLGVRVVTERGDMAGTSFVDPPPGDTSRIVQAFVRRSGRLTAVPAHRGYPDTTQVLMNNRGLVAGTTGVPGTGPVVSWVLRAHGTEDLGSLPGGGRSVRVGAMDDRGRIAGSSDSGEVQEVDGTLIEVSRAFRWESGRMSALERVPGAHWVDIRALNRRGQVAGNAIQVLATSPWSQVQQAVRWDGKRAAPLGVLPGGDNSGAVAMNDAGQVAGWSETGEKTPEGRPVWHPVLWTGGGIADLGLLPGTITARVRGINRQGQVAGTADTGRIVAVPLREERAFLWEKGKLMDLGRLPGSLSSWVLGLNDRGQVLGASLFRPHAGLVTYRPWIWQNGVMTDLNDLLPPDSGWTLTDSLGYRMNNRGWIAGPGSFRGAQRSFLLQP